MGSLESLDWLNRFLQETPGDSVIGGEPRQVPGVCWSKVSPTKPTNPSLRLWSSEMGNTLGIEMGSAETLGGGSIVQGISVVDSPPIYKLQV